MIRITQLADVTSVLKVSKVVRETAVVKVTRDSAGFLSFKTDIPDHVIDKDVSFKGWNKLEHSTSTCI